MGDYWELKQKLTENNDTFWTPTSEFSGFFFPDTEAGVQLQLRNNPSNSLDVCQPSIMPEGPEPKGVKETWERGGKEEVLQGIFGRK